MRNPLFFALLGVALVGCGGGGGGGTDDGPGNTANRFQGDYTGTYSRALQSAPTTTVESDTANFAADAFGQFTMTLRNEGTVTGVVSDSGTVSRAVFARTTTSNGVDRIGLSDMTLSLTNNTLDVRFTAGLNQDGSNVNVYTASVVR